MKKKFLLAKLKHLPPFPQLVLCHHISFENTQDVYFEDADESDLYEHLVDSESHHDAQTMDAATEDQMKEKESVPTATEEGEDMEEGDEEKMTIEEDKQEEVGSLGKNIMEYF